MLTIEVDYLTGSAVATDRERRSEPEWPPHPQRLFSALVAAYKECDFGSDERAALEWLEQLSPPSLSFVQAAPREAVAVYVPVNDVSTPDTAPKDIGNALKAMPDHRPRQERYFPTVIPGSSMVHFTWTDATDDDASKHRPALERLAAEVGYLGHSMSLVRVAVTGNSPEFTLEPILKGEAEVQARLRTVGSGRLSLLERLYNQSVEGFRRIEAPDIPRTGYRKPTHAEAIDRNVFGDRRNWFVFRRVKGRPLPLESCLALTSSVRRAVCNACDDSLAALLCGHEPDGRPTDKPHATYLPLAHVDHRFADGEIFGFAIVLPDKLQSADRDSILRGLGRLRKVWNNESDLANRSLAFDWQVEMTGGDERRQTLLPRSYTRASRYWATVTPVVFGHFLRKLDDARTERIVAECCKSIGLPRPVRVSVSPVSQVLGAPISGAFPSLSARGKPVWTTFRGGRHRVPRKLPDGTPVRMRYHVALEFETPVQGPVILGAGRYFGMGLCRPLSKGGAARS